MSDTLLLEGIRVLDLSRMLAGPVCTALLADVGCDVIKVETVGRGDDMRHVAPFKEGESALFMLANRGKKSITLDLKSERGVEILHRLAAASDVVVENFKPGVAKRLGADYDTLKEINPRLVYASISGFGQHGPLAHRPAYDIVAQAMSGLMSITGEADGPPIRVGESFGDLCASLYGAWGIMVGLNARERTGEGQYLDVAMVDSLFSLLITALSQYLFAGQTPVRVGNRHPLSTPYDSFQAGDGHVIIAVANDRLFKRLAEAMDRPELATDRRFVTDSERTRHEPELRAIIEEWTGARTVEDTVAALDAVSVPASPIWTVEQVADSAQMKFREMLAKVHHPALGEITLVQQPVHFSAMKRGIRRPPPRLGEHTDDVLGGLLGLEVSTLAELRRDGVI